MEIATGQILLVCQRGHRLARRRSVSLEELAEECFVASPPGSRGRDYIDRIFAKAGIAPNAPYEVNDAATTLDFVEAGLGVALVIESMAAGRPELRTVALAEPSFAWTVALVAPPADQLTPAAGAFLEIAGSAATGTRREVPGPGAGES